TASSNRERRRRKSGETVPKHSTKSNFLPRRRTRRSIGPTYQRNGSDALQPIILIQFRLNFFQRRFTGDERRSIPRSSIPAHARSNSEKMTMKPTLTLLCIGTATFI